MLNIAMASSNEYSSFLLISLTSLLENNVSDFDLINIFILDDGIDEVNKNKILELSKKYPCNIILIQLTIFDSINVELVPIELKSTMSLTTYSRLFLSSILPNDVNKVLFLDCDSLILGSFKELWEMDIEDYYCAGVLDPLATPAVKKFWFYNVNSYINAGVLLVNLKKWRTDNVEQKFIKFLSDNQGRFFWVDQGVINLTFDNKIKVVEPKYNLLFYYQFYDYDIAKMLCGNDSEYYTKEIVDDSRNNPVFVHFAGEGYGVPWHNKDHKYSLMYENYAKKANCHEVIHYIDAPTLKSKLLYKYDNIFVKALFKLIPSKIIINFINKGRIESFKKKDV